MRCVCVCSYTKWVWYQPTDSFSSNICTQHCGGSAEESGGECSEPWALPGAPVLVLSPAQPWPLLGMFWSCQIIHIGLLSDYAFFKLCI